MTQTDSATVFEVGRAWDCGKFKRVVAEAGYSDTALAKTLSLSCPHERQDVELVYRRVKEDTPYNVLFRLFRLGRAEAESTLGEMVGGLDVEALVEVGLLRRREGKLESVVKLTPYHELLLVSDFEPPVRREMSVDHVLGVGGASMTLAGLTVRREVDRVLDLGTGAGIQAFLAGRHGRQVVGTDTNERALNFARFNAQLNDIEGLEWRRGSLWEPVAHEQFDLIVTNPPYVISPESRFTFRDTRLPGDEISEQVIRGAGARLNEGGFASVLFNWHHQNEDDWAERPLSWVEENGCDSWLLRFNCEEPLTYAAEWLSNDVGKDSPKYGPHLDEWIAYYEEMKIERISAGVMIMRRRGGQKNWRRSDAIDSTRSIGSNSDQIERIFAIEDLLETLGDDRELLDMRFEFDEHHRLEHQLKVEDGRWAIQGEQLHAAKGIPFAGRVDMYIAQLLAGCDGSRTLRELIAEGAERAEADAEDMIPVFLKALRKLMRSGFLSLARTD